MRAPSDDLAIDQRQILADIAEGGLHIARVAKTADAPGWCYTVGLWHTFGQPELIVVGLTADVAHDLLDHCADEIDGGRTLAAGQQCEGLIHGYPVRLGAVTATQAHRWLPLLAWAYEGADVPCVQIVYPDKQGRWPWQSDVREGFAALQPVLEREQQASAS